LTERTTPRGGKTGSDAPPASSVAHRFGQPAGGGAVPRREDVRVTAPDLARRAALERTRGRLVLAAGGFAVLFGALVVKLADATILQPMKPRPEAAIRKPEAPPAPGAPAAPPTGRDFGNRVVRATITDRNGLQLAISLPTASVFANPREMIDAADAAHKLKSVLPRLDEEQVAERLSSEKQFVYLARQITPREQLAINTLGIPGVYFEPTERRRYPQGRVASQVLGGVDVDGHGVAGVERFFDQKLHDEPEPVRLSLDVRVQQVVRDELSKAITDFTAIGGCGIVMDVRTGEVLAMVSLPDYDANDVGRATGEQRFNRAVTGMYEPGSTFKLQTAAMTLDTGAGQLWNIYDASGPIHFGRFTINDFEGKHRPLYFPEVIAYSSNIGAAKMAASVGPERQREWHRRMGMLGRLGIELPEAGQPIVPHIANWKEIATMTIGFGHGIAVSPLHVVRGTAAIANGGVVLRPTILARAPDAPPPQGERVMSQGTSDIMRKLMRLVVSDGFGKSAEVPGYFVGGKTGTAEKATAGGYKKHVNIQAFMSVFPMNAPRYAVYMMLDEAHANASTHGYATAGWIAAPAAGRVIARIGPMLGLLPETENVAAIQASLAIPLQPVRPANAPANIPAPRPAPVAGPVTNGKPPIASARPPVPVTQPAAQTRPQAPTAPQSSPLQRDAVTEPPRARQAGGESQAVAVR
jgi:cell division protein FtsI (penicillin-binding protein 3)